MRTNYNNGDEIGLKHTGCDGCSPLNIDGYFHHELKCPEAWKDIPKTCYSCGRRFYEKGPTMNWHDCPECNDAYVRAVEQQNQMKSGSRN